MNRLILVVNDTCSLRCPHCVLRFGRRSMPLKTVVAALESFLAESMENSCIIKLSGGEPLINFSRLKRIIGRIRTIARHHKKKITIQLCTNAACLKEAFAPFLASSDIDLSVTWGCAESPLTPSHQEQLSRIVRFSQKKPLTIHAVIAPTMAGSFYGSFLGLAESGLKRFNILPAYYTVWSKRQLLALKKDLRSVADYIKNHRRDDLLIRNSASFSRVPLFNEGVVVDCQGDVYLSNFFLARWFKKISGRFKLGNVHRKIQPTRTLSSYLPQMTDLRACLPRRVYASTLAADRILTGFVKAIAP